MNKTPILTGSFAISLGIAVCCFTVFPTILRTASIPTPANIRITNIPQLNNEEQVFFSPLDSNIIIANWRDFRLGFRQVGIGRSTDGGMTWTDSLIEPLMQYTNIINGVGFGAWQSDPTMTVDAEGNFYMSILDFSPSAPPENDTSFIVFYKSADKGISWIGPFPTLPLPGPQFEDKQFITVDRTGGPHHGNVYVSWTRFPNPDRIVFQRSIDGGQTFGDTIIVGPILTSSPCGASLIDAGQFSIPIVSSDGSVHVIWIGRELDSTFCQINSSVFHHVTSFDGGQTFSPRTDILRVSGFTQAPGGLNTYSQPAGDADITGGPFDGNVYISFTNRGPEDMSLFRTDVDFIRSTDNGITWGGRIQINDDPDNQLADSFHPWLTVNQEGVVIVVFEDHRENPPLYRNFDLFAAYSFDGGETFSANHRISDVSSTPESLLGASLSKPRVWPRDENGDVIMVPVSSRAGLLGEYIGVTAFFDKINAVWTDSRDGNSEVYTANWYLPLLEPRLRSPAEGEQVTASPQLSWATSWKHNQDRYRVEVSSDMSFSNPLLLQDSLTIDTNFAVVSLSGDGTAFWRVKTFDIVTGDSSDYSAVRSFIVDNVAPTIATLLAPDDQKTFNIAKPSFDWSDVFDINFASYELNLSQDSLFLSPGSVTFDNISFSEFSLPQPLTIEGVYFWRVRALDVAGNSSTSETFSFSYIDFTCGDANGSGAVNIADVTFLIARIFAGGIAPVPQEAGDANGSGGINIADVTYLIARIFAGGPAPICP